MKGGNTVERICEEEEQSSQAQIATVSQAELLRGRRVMTSASRDARLSSANREKVMRNDLVSNRHGVKHSGQCSWGSS